MSKFFERKIVSSLKWGLFAFLCLAVGGLLFSKSIDRENAQWQRFVSSYIDYNFMAGRSIHHYAVRKKDGSYLVAGDTPKDLNLKFNFTRSELLRVKVVSQYPEWICERASLGKAYIHFSGKNVDERFRLNSAGTHEFLVKTFRTQPIAVTISNSKQAGCGRAEIFFHSPPNKLPLVKNFIVFWACIALLILVLRQTPTLLLLGMSIYLIGVSAMPGFSAISFSTLYWLNGVSVIVMGLILLIRAIPLKWLRNLLWTTTVAPVVWLFVALFLYEKKFGKTIDQDSIHAVMQTHLMEAWEYSTTLFSLPYLALFLLTPLILLALTVYFERRLEIARGVILGVCFTFLGLSLILGSRSELPLLEVIEQSVSSYFFELNLFVSLLEKRHSISSIGDLNRESDGEQTLVVVIGESANRDHLGIYGYGRNTTPFAQKLVDSGQMLRFNFAYANHTHTNPSLSYALTRANQYSGESWTSAPSLLNVAKSAGIQTH